MSKFEKASLEVADFIKNSPSCYHVIANAKAMLKEAGAIEVREEDKWKLEPGKTYFTTRNGSSVIAFKIPEGKPSNFQIVASHSDSPSFKLKENEEIKKAGHYVELNVEKYGGMLCAPWFDRPLSIAGRAVVEENGVLKTKLVNFDRDLVMLPSLAIHMNREANTNMSYANVQNDMIPVFGDEQSEGKFQEMLADELNVAKEDILGTDLFLYARSEASVWGANREYFSSPKLDDLQCAYSSLKAFISASNDSSVIVCSIFDNEEVGSGTKQGADSTFLDNVLMRIVKSLGYSDEKYLRMIISGFMVSADNGHAIHPNHPEKADVTNRPYMNGGVLIKYNANQKYTTDSVSAAVFKQICKKADIPFQVFFNNSNVLGGSTLGNISNAHVSLNTVDIGVAQLAMHSPYETGGIKDTWYLEEAMRAFYQSHISRDEDGNYTV